jgi:hypothetical protein
MSATMTIENELAKGQLLTSRHHQVTALRAWPQPQQSQLRPLFKSIATTQRSVSQTRSTGREAIFGGMSGAYKGASQSPMAKAHTQESGSGRCAGGP